MLRIPGKILPSSQPEFSKVCSLAACPSKYFSQQLFIIVDFFQPTEQTAGDYKMNISFTMGEEMRLTSQKIRSLLA